MPAIVRLLRRLFCPMHRYPPTLCNCSLGHVMNFIEAFLGRSLRGRVIRSVLSGDLTCEYEIAIPDDIIAEYVTPWETDIIIQNYYQYYRAFTLSGIVELHENELHPVK